MISQPLDRLGGQLSGHFTEEHKGINIVIKILEEVITALDVLQPYDLIEQEPGCITDRNACAMLEKWGSVPAMDLFDQHLKDQSLKDLLGSQGTSENRNVGSAISSDVAFYVPGGDMVCQRRIEIIPVLLAERLRASGGVIRLEKG